MAIITDAQLKEIQDRVATLVADKADADAKTQAANAANTAASQAQAAASQANLDEAAADAKATGDLQDLVHYLDGLAASPTIPAPAPAPDPLVTTG